MNSDSEVLMNAPLLAVLSSQANDRATQVKAGVRISCTIKDASHSNQTFMPPFFLTM